MSSCREQKEWRQPKKCKNTWWGTRQGRRWVILLCDYRMLWWNIVTISFMTLWLIFLFLCTLWFITVPLLGIIFVINMWHKLEIWHLIHLQCRSNLCDYIYKVRCTDSIACFMCFRHWRAAQHGEQRPRGVRGPVQRGGAAVRRRHARRSAWEDPASRCVVGSVTEPVRFCIFPFLSDRLRCRLKVFL